MDISKKYEMAFSKLDTAKGLLDDAINSLHHYVSDDYFDRNYSIQSIREELKLIRLLTLKVDKMLDLKYEYK